MYCDQRSSGSHQAVIKDTKVYDERLAVCNGWCIVLWYMVGQIQFMKIVDCYYIHTVFPRIVSALE